MSDLQMKLKYFIPFLVLSAFALEICHVAVLGVTASWSSHFLKEDYGQGTFLIIRASFAILTSLVVGVLAFPLGYISRKPGSLYALMLPLLGLTLVINPWNNNFLSMIMWFYPEYLTYIVSCWIFWKLGNRFRLSREAHQSTESNYETEVA